MCVIFSYAHSRSFKQLKDKLWFVNVVHVTEEFAATVALERTLIKLSTQVIAVTEYRENATQ